MVLRNQLYTSVRSAIHKFLSSLREELKKPYTLNWSLRQAGKISFQLHFFIDVNGTDLLDRKVTVEADCN